MQSFRIFSKWDCYSLDVDEFETNSCSWNGTANEQNAGCNVVG